MYIKQFFPECQEGSGLECLISLHWRALLWCKLDIKTMGRVRTNSQTEARSVTTHRAEPPRPRYVLNTADILNHEDRKLYFVSNPPLVIKWTVLVDSNIFILCIRFMFHFYKNHDYNNRSCRCRVMTLKAHLQTCNVSFVSSNKM